MEKVGKKGGAMKTRFFRISGKPLGFELILYRKSPINRALFVAARRFYLGPLAVTVRNWNWGGWEK